METDQQFSKIHMQEGSEKKFRMSSPLGVGWSGDLCERFAGYYLGPKGRNIFEPIGWLVPSGIKSTIT